MCARSAAAQEQWASRKPARRAAARVRSHRPAEKCVSICRARDVAARDAFETFAAFAAVKAVCGVRTRSTCESPRACKPARACAFRDAATPERAESRRVICTSLRTFNLTRFLTGAETTFIFSL